MTPKELVREWIKRFNSGEIDSLLELYAVDAINEQAVFSKPLEGRKEIRLNLELDFSRAKMECIEERIYECGDTAILQWRDPAGLKGCGFFKFQNELIVHQKGYFDQLSFLRAQGLPIPEDYLNA
jgi:hypothetical protein